MTGRDLPISSLQEEVIEEARNRILRQLGVQSDRSRIVTRLQGMLETLPNTGVSWPKLRRLHEEVELFRKERLKGFGLDDVYVGLLASDETGHEALRRCLADIERDEVLIGNELESRVRDGQLDPLSSSERSRWQAGG